MKTWIVIFVLTFTGCVKTGLVSLDHDTYMVEKRNTQFGFGPAEELKADVYREATDFCTKLNKKMETVKFEMTDVGFIVPGNVSLQFRCVRNSAVK